MSMPHGRLPRMTSRMHGIHLGMKLPEILPKGIHSAMHGIRNRKHRASCAVLYRLKVLIIILQAHSLHHARRLRKTLKGRDTLRTLFTCGRKFLTTPIRVMFHAFKKIQHRAFKALTNGFDLSLRVRGGRGSGRLFNCINSLQHEFGK